MRVRRVALSLALAVVLAPAGALAALRTIQFTGAALAHFNRLDTTKVPASTPCAVTVMNTGLSPQRVEAMQFVVYDPTTDKNKVLTAPTLGAIYNGGAGTTCGIVSGSPCLGQDIEPGGTYVGVAFVPRAAVGGTGISYCLGSATISDSAAGQRGSVVASGSISYVGEYGYTGGQFNGAVYFGGTHLESSSAANAALLNAATVPTWTNSSVSSEAIFPSGTNWEAINQMDLFCPQACRKGLSSSVEEFNWCPDDCGSQHQYHVGKKVIGLGEDNDTGAYVTDIYKMADPQWAGGYVMEMIMGPFDSICSANKAYFDNGGTDFSHVDTIDADGGQALASPNTTNRGPPERLYCAHTHLRDIPYGSFAFGVPFEINGGLPF